MSEPGDKRFRLIEPIGMDPPADEEDRGFIKPAEPASKIIRPEPPDMPRSHSIFSRPLVLPSPVISDHFPTWRTVKLGVHLTIGEYVSAIEMEGSRISDLARSVAFKVVFPEALSEIELVVVTGFDIGLEGKYTTALMFAAAKARGLFECPAEVGLALREQYPEQVKGECLLVAMKPVKGHGIDLCLFGVEHDDRGRWLYVYSGIPDFVWDVGRRWVFLRNKQS